MIRVRLMLCVFLLLRPAGAQPTEIHVPAGTPLVASIPEHLPLRVGQTIDAGLVYAVYVNNVVALPAGTHVRGRITGLTPDHDRRLAARLRGDFTPFHKPIVQFDGIVMSDGRVVPMRTSAAVEGAPIFRLVAPPPRKGGFLRQQIDTGVQMAKERIGVVTGPEKKDRLVQLAYSQMPYHPQRIAKGTAWTIETTAPLELQPEVAAGSGADPEPERPAADAPGTTRGGPSGTWTVNAYLDEPLNSASTKPGQLIHATVAEPILNADHTIAVPQGAALEGAVTLVRPARRFGRAGVLRFDFRQITLPTGESESVQASLTGIDSAGSGNLSMDSEGKVKPKPQDKLLVPLILFSLAARPLDRDGRSGGDGQFGKDAVASNALGLAGFLAGTLARAPNFASGIGYYGTALSLYNRWIKRGVEIGFAKDTRITVQTTARRSTLLRPAAR